MINSPILKHSLLRRQRALFKNFLLFSSAKKGCFFDGFFGPAKQMWVNLLPRIQSLHYFPLLRPLTLKERKSHHLDRHLKPNRLKHLLPMNPQVPVCLLPLVMPWLRWVRNCSWSPQVPFVIL